MFVDASAIVAIINQEADSGDLLKQMEAASQLLLSPIARFEAVLAIARVSARTTDRLVMAQTLDDAGEIVGALIDEMGMREVDLSQRIGTLAIEASARYGKVVRHPAKLSLGDCFAYACAAQLRVPLLCKGDDFALTDLA